MIRGMGSEPLVRVHVLSVDGRTRQAARSLPAERFRVAFSEDMNQMLEGLQTQACDVAVIDLSLNGFAMAKDLRASTETGSSKIVMLCERQHDVWLCRQAGADQVLIKPLDDPSVLIDAVSAAAS